MAKTIIDELIVALKLDPKDFKKGEKEAAQALVDLKNKADDAGKATEKSGQSFKEAAVKLGLWAMVLKGFARSAEAILDASRATRQLGFDARNYDIAADKLRNFENAAKMFGGTAEGVLKTVGGLQRAVFNLSFNGQMSDQLVQLGRLGVAFQDRTGHARDFKDIYLDTADAIKNQVDTGKMTEGEAMAFLASAGIGDEGLARAALGGRRGAARALDQQSYGRQITSTDIAKATAIEESKTRKDIDRQATAVEAMETTAPVIEKFYDMQSALFEELMTGFPSLRSNVTGFFHSVGEFFSPAGFKNMVKGALGLGTVADRNNNPGNLTDASTGGFRSFATPEAGMAAAQRQLGLYRGRGNNTLRGMIGKWNPANAPGNSPANLAAYIADVSKQTGIDADKPTTSADDAAILAAMFNHEGSAKTKYDAASVADALSLQQQAATRGGSSSATTTVDIGEVNVITAATDANGIAGSIADATRRKFTAAQAPSQGPQ